MNRMILAGPLLACSGIVLVLAGCNPAAPAPSAKNQSVLSTVVEGRTINATVPAPSMIHPEGDGAVISSQAHKIKIERERVVVDGNELVKLPAETKNVQL